MAKTIPPIDNDEQKTSSMVTFNRYIDSIEPWSILTHQQYAKNTLVAFKNDWNNFLAFCIENKVTPLPSTPDTVHRYIEHMSRTRKLSSLKRYVVTIGLVHRCHQLPDPCAKTEIRLAMKKQQLEKHDDYRNASPFRDEHLQRLLYRFELSVKVKDIRDMAIWAVAFEAMLKRSELANLTLDATEIHSNGLIELTVADKTIALSSVASKALQRWLVVSMINDGYIFRRIDRHSNIGEAPLDHSSIYRVFRRASDELGLPTSIIFSGQSPRVGAAKDLADSGLSISEIQDQGRWKSPAMPAQYVGNTDLHDKEIAKYVKEKPWEK
ncbi:tyrosine-type recombinase/integrase [Photobacterium sp. SDRW27]|uniref:tyrosine-type recombinase/integrase n=1 Tax=Photobacterium obscurum TaxID=2829490 RepID=UPI0022432CD2|nr:tyrosine-type recombinase/integrase [Photobacterium obscurum]MCW8329413.1 tyrosine-type recombinase/integrase [Photobacterium obscurum]